MANRALPLIALTVFCITPASSTPQTQVVLLGTGTPGPDPERSGPATAIAIEDRAYLVDFGPGIVRGWERSPGGPARESENRVCHAPSFRPHSRLPRSDLHTVGYWTKGGAAGVWAARSESDDGPSDPSVGRGHRHSYEWSGAQLAVASRRPGNPARPRVLRQSGKGDGISCVTRRMEGGVRLSLQHTGSDDRYLRRRATKSRTNRGVQPLRYTRSRGVLSSIPGANARLAEIPSALPHLDVRAGRDCAADPTRTSDSVSPHRSKDPPSGRAVSERGPPGLGRKGRRRSRPRGVLIQLHRHRRSRPGRQQTVSRPRRRK